METNSSSPRLGELLLQAQLITEDELEEALRVHAETGRRLGEVISELALVSISELQDVLLVQRRWRPLGQMLLERGLLDESQLLDALDEQENTGLPLGEVIRERYRLSSAALEGVLQEQREIEIELDRGYTSGLREALQRRGRGRTVPPEGEAARSPARTFGLAERLALPVSEMHTHMAVKHAETSEKKLHSMSVLLEKQREELERLRDALADRQLTIIELEQHISELEAARGEHTAGDAA